MEGYFQTGVGILVSIILFLLGYRQTVGVKKERIRTANKEVEKILIRRVVNEKFNLSIIDIKRLLEGKARDFKVKIEELYSEEQILNAIFTRILETDFINQEQRDNIIAKLNPLIEGAEEYVDNSEALYFNKSIFGISGTNNQFYLPLTIALMSSVTGVFFTFILFLRNGSSDINLYVLFITFSISLIFIAFIVIFKNSKESQTAIPLSSDSVALENALNFEKEVIGAVAKYKYEVFLPKNNKRNFDFSFKLNNKKVLIEIKTWRTSPPPSYLKRLLARFSEVVLIEGAAEGIIVVQKPIRLNNELLEENNVRIMTINEFKKYISK